ncbi:hypothetical protein [Corynebacterium pacaense]|uniref:baeRF11 domain-containing protein n=1 Tax=Corynebacterium pacaense TaxID=1816684 RepID=UPI0009BB279F|nr:hypothetical protein [Corynebacterium pacaense]
MHTDIPTRTDIEELAATRESFCVSIYLPTSLRHTGAEKTQLTARKLFDAAMEEVEKRTDRRSALPVREALNELLDDRDFWSRPGRSLAVFLTPTGITEYRLPNELGEHVAVSDRFSITPLLRAVTFPHSALVLALSQNGARLVEVTADEPATEVSVPDLPGSAEEAVGLPSISGRAPYGRLQGGEGRKVRLTQYARAVDHALRPILNGTSLPLIVAATEPILSIYRNLAGYRGLTEESIRGNSDEISDAELADSARGILDRIYDRELAELKELFSQRRNSGRAVTDLSDLARSTASGAIATLVVNFEAEVAGSVDDAGNLDLGDTDFDALEEIARRALATGARVLAVRSADLPEGVVAAGILRFAS